jgi:catechol 2,3-dioxygenase-like lactoylglutathione lyase family enzyme
MPETKFEFKGLDHVALIVKDMKATVDFYHGALGMPVLHTLEYFDDAGQLTGQHWFFGVGDPANPNAHIATFWWKDGYQTLPEDANPITVKPANSLAAPIGKMLHVNLRVDPDKIGAYCERLGELRIPFRHSVRYFDPQNPPVMRAVNSFDKYVEPENGALMSSVYVDDPSGIQVEFNAWLNDWDKWPNDAVPRSNDDD